MSIASKNGASKNGPSKRVGTGNRDHADWTAVDGRWLAEAIAAVAARGGALRFGYTRDGGAYAVGVYGDGDKPYTDYIKPGESVEAYLEQLVYAWTDGTG